MVSFHVKTCQEMTGQCKAERVHVTHAACQYITLARSKLVMSRQRTLLLYSKDLPLISSFGG